MVQLTKKKEYVEFDSQTLNQYLDMRPNVVSILLLVHNTRRWPNIKTALFQSPENVISGTSKRTQDIESKLYRNVSVLWEASVAKK